MSDVVVKNLIGGKDAKDACIDAKAMQSRMLFFFSVHLLNQIVPRLQGDLRETAEGLAKSSACLVEWYNIILSKSGAFSVDVCNNAINLAKKHVTLWRAHTGSTPKPKHHALVDLSRQMHRFGNPSWWSTYSDESLNSMIARLARTVHPAHFALTTLKKYFLQRSLKGLSF